MHEEFKIVITSLSRQGAFSIVNGEYLFNEIIIDNPLAQDYLARTSFEIADTIIHETDSSNIYIKRGKNTLIVSKYRWEGMRKFIDDLCGN